MTANFFTDYNVPKNAKIAIDGLERVIPRTKHSHNAAWVRLYRNMLQSAGWEDVTILKKDDTYDDYDALIIYLGISYGGAINFFFGVDDNVCWRFKRIQDFDGPTFVLNHDMPLVGTTVGGRLHNKSTSIHVKDLKLELLDDICKNTRRIDYVEKTSSLCFGDSHCFSTYRPGQMVCRNDGMTLYGLLNAGLREQIEEKAGVEISSLDQLTFYAGNIDIRHHLMRQDNPYESCKNLAQALGSQLDSLPIKEIEIVQALPIENEARKLPKTGYYKGTPFYGTWEERNKLVDTFNSCLDRITIPDNGLEVFTWPRQFKNQNGELDFDFMERPKSVHLSPQSYRWDLENNQPNPLYNGDK